MFKGKNISLCGFFLVFNNSINTMESNNTMKSKQQERERINKQLQERQLFTTWGKGLLKSLLRNQYHENNKKTKEEEEEEIQPTKSTIFTQSILYTFNPNVQKSFIEKLKKEHEAQLQKERLMLLDKSIQEKKNNQISAEKKVKIFLKEKCNNFVLNDFVNNKIINLSDIKKIEKIPCLERKHIDNANKYYEYMLAQYNTIVLGEKLMKFAEEKERLEKERLEKEKREKQEKQEEEKEQDVSIKYLEEKMYIKDAAYGAYRSFYNQNYLRLEQDLELLIFYINQIDNHKEFKDMSISHRDEILYTFLLFTTSNNFKRDFLNSEKIHLENYAKLFSLLNKQVNIKYPRLKHLLNFFEKLSYLSKNKDLIEEKSLLVLPGLCTILLLSQKLIENFSKKPEIIDIKDINALIEELDSINILDANFENDKKFFLKNDKDKIEFIKKWLEENLNYVIALGEDEEEFLLLTHMKD